MTRFYSDFRNFLFKEHLDFMNNAGAHNFDFQPFKQLQYDYSGYQSLTDVPKASAYTEDFINIQASESSKKQKKCFTKTCANSHFHGSSPV